MCRRRSILAVLLGLWTGCAVGQTLPNHVDPSARDILPDLTSLPAIRFLTAADFPPFNYRDENGALVGFNIDLARRICAEVDVPCTIQTWPWEQAANALADKQGDALIAGLALTAENGERFDFSAIYLALPGRFVTRADAARDFNPSDLDGRTISVREGSAHEEFLHRYLPDVEVTASEDEIAALQAVESGQADVYFGDAMRASFWLNDNLACCSFAGEAYFRPDLFGQGLAIALPAGHDSVRHAIDWALVRLKRSGSLDELYLRWFPIGFY